ncbi:MAG: hypothetical protein ACYC4U_10330 [Pirellulaceae bacterium]
MRLPELLKHHVPLYHYTKYQPGTVERAKSLCSNLLSQLEAADSCYSLYDSTKELAKRERVWERLGYPSIDELLLALTGKTESQADSSKRSQQASIGTTGAVLPPGGDQKSKAAKAAKSIPNLGIGTQRERAKRNGISHYTQEKLDRLARDHKKLHARVSAGELSVHRACIEAGITKEKTNVERAIAALRKCGPDELRRVAEWMEHEAGRG